MKRIPKHLPGAGRRKRRVVPLLLALAPLLTAAPAVAVIHFDAPYAAIAAGGPQYAVALGDLDGDGRPDVISADLNGGQVVVFRNLGDGAFGPPTVYAVFCSPTCVAVADLNGDGKPDVVVGNDCGPGKISVLLGNGNGTLRPHVDYVVMDFAHQVVVADLDGDGKLDLAAPCGSGVSILFGAGDGTFGGRVDVPVAGQPLGVAAADFNGDARVDLAVSENLYGYGGELSLVRNAGGRSFAWAAAYPCGRQAWVITAGDVNGDGRPDVVTANRNDLNGYGPGSTSVLLADGAGGFAPQHEYATDLLPNDVVITDADRDGVPDLVLACSESGSVNVLRGTGAGTFAAAVSIRAGLSPSGVRMGDVDGDGLPDLVVADRAQDGQWGFVNVLSGRPDGGFGVHDVVPTRPEPISVAVADLDGDAIPDLAIGSLGDYSSTGGVSVARGLGDGRFDPRIDLAPFASPLRVFVTDLDRNGRPDLVAANSGGFAVYRGLGGLAFAGPVAVAPAVHYLAGCVTADWNGDGIPDLAAIDQDFLAAADTLRVSLGRGDGSFGAPRARSLRRYSLAIAAGDLNGDHVTDLAVVDNGYNSFAPGHCSILLGNGDGTFRDGSGFDTPAQPEHVVVADMDVDGRPDVVVSGALGYAVGFARNLGGASFAPVLTTPVTNAPGELAVADFDRDGRPDLAVAGSTMAGSDVIVLRGTGGGVLADPLLFGGEINVTCIAAALIDADGLPDLVVGGNYGNFVTVLLNTPTGSATPALASLLEISPGPGGVNLRWSVLAATGALGLERSVTDGAWYRLASVTPDRAGAVVYLDASVEPSRRYTYRLVDAGGVELAGSRAAVDVPAVADARISRVWPNPARDRAWADLRLAPGASATLELIDVAGRRVRSVELSGDDSGAASTSIDLAGTAPGLYHLRMTQGRRVTVKPIAVVR